MATIFSTHTEGRNHKKVLENCTTIRNLFIRVGERRVLKWIIKSKRIPSIFKDESTGSCICLWKLAVAVATYVSTCIVYRILPSFAF
jgi:hypothetical protein